MQYGYKNVSCKQTDTKQRSLRSKINGSYCAQNHNQTVVTNFQYYYRRALPNLFFAYVPPSRNKDTFVTPEGMGTPGWQPLCCCRPKKGRIMTWLHKNFKWSNKIKKFNFFPRKLSLPSLSHISHYQKLSWVKFDLISFLTILVSNWSK